MIKDYYAEKNIPFYNYSIIDMDNEDYISKAHIAVKILNFLIIKHKVKKF